MLDRLHPGAASLVSTHEVLVAVGAVLYSILQPSTVPLHKAVAARHLGDSNMRTTGELLVVAISPSSPRRARHYLGKLRTASHSLLCVSIHVPSPGVKPLSQWPHNPAIIQARGGNQLIHKAEVICSAHFQHETVSPLSCMQLLLCLGHNHMQGHNPGDSHWTTPARHKGRGQPPGHSREKW